MATMPRSRLSLLLDVDPSDIVDGVTLRYDATAEMWKAVLDTGGGGTGGGGFLPDYANTVVVSRPAPFNALLVGPSDDTHVFTPVTAGKWNEVHLTFLESAYVNPARVTITLDPDGDVFGPLEVVNETLGDLPGGAAQKQVSVLVPPDTPYAVRVAVGADSAYFFTLHYEFPAL